MSTQMMRGLQQQQHAPRALAAAPRPPAASSSASSSGRRCRRRAAAAAPPRAAGGSSGGGLSYKAAGVDIDAGDELVRRIQKLNPSIGGFSGLVPFGDSYLVAGTDGVGTKLKLAFDMDKHDTVGVDLVAMSVNDIVTSGAAPMFFLDYYATGALDVDAAEQVGGVAETVPCTAAVPLGIRWMDCRCRCHCRCRRRFDCACRPPTASPFCAHRRPRRARTTRSSRASSRAAARRAASCSAARPPRCRGSTRRASTTSPALRVRSRDHEITRSRDHHWLSHGGMRCWMEM